MSFRAESHIPSNAAVNKDLLSSAQARRQVVSAVADAVLDAVSFDENSTLVMDYACGSGALSQKLAPYSKSIIGVDIDPAVVEEFNTKVANQGIPPEEMRGICLGLPEQAAELHGQLFDVVVVSPFPCLVFSKYEFESEFRKPWTVLDKCSQAYHHFLDINATTRLLASFLKPQTGVLLVSDLLKGPHAHEFRQPCAHPHGHYHNVIHRGGLTEIEIRNSFEAAGLVDIDFDIIETIRKDERNVDIFLAQGVRPATENFR